MHIQQRNQNRRDLVKLATELAIDDYNRRLKVAEDQNLSISFPPIAAFVAYQIRVLEEMSSGVFDAEKIKKISKEQEAILDAFKNVAQERRNSKKAE